MELKERLKRGLVHTRGFTDKVLAEFTDDQDWIRRSCENGNHALWIAGHLGYTIDYFIGLIDSEQQRPQENFSQLFGKSTQPSDDLQAYPSPNEVRDYLAERGEAFLQLLERSTEEDLNRVVPNGPGFMYDVGAVFQMGAWHEAMHSGQLTVIHRMIGQTPIADRN